MKCLRVYATADGESHFDQVEIPTSSRQVPPRPRRSKCRQMMRRHASVSRAFRRARDIPPRLIARADEVIEWAPRVAARESGSGTFETCRSKLTMSVDRGRPEVGGGRSEWREWPCAPRARSTGEGGSHPDNCRLARKLAGGTAG